MKTKTLKVVVVNNGRAVECNCPVGAGGTLEVLQALVGGLIERLPSGHDDYDCFINEEGLYIGGALQIEKVTGEGHEVVGTIVYSGHDGAGETISLTAAQVRMILEAYK